MKRSLIMNLQLFGLGQVPQRLLNVDGGAGTGGATGGEGTSGGSNGTGEGSNDKTFDDVLKNKEYQSEFDKRVAKALETSRSKWETEFQAKIEEEKTEAEKLAKMKADEKSKYQEEKRAKELEKREKEITTRELKAQAYETLAEKGLPKELVDILNYENADTCSASIESVEKAFQSAVEKAVNHKLRGGEPPRGGQGSNSTGFNFNFTGVRTKDTK